MKIAIGADHGGFDLKRHIIAFLKKQGYDVKDFGVFSPKRCDYPAIGYKVAKEVTSGGFDKGVLICKSGLGMSMVANKVPGIRAAFLRDIKGARSSREHNDANIAVFSGNSMRKGNAEKLLKIWLNTAFKGGRHARRVRQINKIEKKIRAGR